MCLPSESGGLHKLLGHVSQEGPCWLKIESKRQRNGDSAVKNSGFHDVQLIDQLSLVDLT